MGALTQAKLDEVKNQHFPLGNVGFLDLDNQERFCSRLIQFNAKVKEVVLVKSNELSLISNINGSQYLEICSGTKNQNIGILKSVMKKVVK